MHGCAGMRMAAAGLACAAAGASAAVPDAKGLRESFDSIGSGHPRIILTEPGRITVPADIVPYAEALRREAAALQKEPVLERVKIGRRILAVSRRALHRITTLAGAWLVWGDAEALERAKAELLAVCSFPDWNPSHYLDTAEMSLAVAVGYDWLYNDLDPESREKIAEALWRLGLSTALDDSQWWVRAGNNWGQVCHTGVSAAAIALADKYPEEAFEVIERAISNIRKPMLGYAPDGVYPEGPMYWSYGTTYNIVFISMLEAAFGSDFGLSGMEGFADSADYMLAVTGPGGRFCNYADSHDSRRCEAGLLWFADRFPEKFGGRGSGYFGCEWRTLEENPARFASDRLAALLLLPAGDTPVEASPAGGGPRMEFMRDYHGRGKSEFAAMRSGGDRDAWYVAVKGGTPSVSHGHMDAGSFVLEAGGVRWSLELGGEDYNKLEQKGFSLWNGSQDGARWDVFRYGVNGHSQMVVNGMRQRVKGSAALECSGFNGADPSVKVDLRDVLGFDAQRVYYFPGRSRLVTEDHVSGLAAGDVVRWQMVTRASAEVRGNVLTLTQDGLTMTLEADAPDAVWKVAEAGDLLNPWDSPLEGVRVVMFERKSDGTGELRHKVTFSMGGR